MARWLLSTSALLAALCAGCPPSLDRPPPTDSAIQPPLTDLAASDIPAWRLGDNSRNGGAADAAPEGPTPDVQQPDLSSGGWVQADSKNCLDHCTTLGKVNVPSPEGAHCMSGEVRPQSGINDGIVFTYGCWPDCLPQGPTIVSASVGLFCYHDGQTQDYDDTDLTVGCFCH
jgi:hypothetical protein